MHVENTPDGLAVWLGLPGPPAPEVMRSLIASVQRELQFEGRRLERLVCNGSTLYSAPGAKEKP